MATRTEQLWEVRHGETSTRIFAVQDADGDAINVNGYDIKFRVATTRRATTFLIDLDQDDPQVSLVNVAGTDDGVQVALSTTHTAQAPERYFWQLWLQSAGGNAKVTAEGPFVVINSLMGDAA